MTELARVLLDCIILFVWIQMLIHVRVPKAPIRAGEWIVYKAEK